MNRFCARSLTEARCPSGSVINPALNLEPLGELAPYVYSEVFDLKPTSGLYSGSGVLGYWSIGGRMSAVRMNIDRVGSVEESKRMANLLFSGNGGVRRAVQDWKEPHRRF
jgi:hypothetical protein